MSRQPGTLGLLAATLLIVLLASCGDGDAPTSPLTETSISPVSAVATYGITQIGTTEDTYSALAINDDGQVVGAHRFEVGGVSSPSAFLWTNGATQLLPPASISEPSSALDVNAFGIVVGFAGTDATAWENGVITRLALATTTEEEAVATSVNDAGQIVGFDASSESHRIGLFWSSKTDPSPTTLQPAVSGEIFTNPISINSAGVIVGQSGTSSIETDAVVWTGPDAPARPLRGFGGSPCGDVASDINDLGEIVGTCELNGSPHAAYWSSVDADPVDLGQGDATAINELGQIGGHDGTRPLLWNPEAGVFRRFELGVPEESASLTTFFQDLNNTGEAAGHTITSVGFVWTIPMNARVDVSPGSAANKIKRDGRGTITVAILGSRWFRATDVDPATLTLGNDDGVETPIARRQRGPLTRLTDVDRDGITDLIAEFDERQLMNGGDLPPDAQTLVLLGRTRNGGHIRGVDVVQVTQ